MLLRSIVILLALLILGDAIADRFMLPVPGAVLGMLVLVTYFALGEGPDRASAHLFDLAAPHFPMFFVPAAVGVIANLELLMSAWLFMSIAIVLSTTLAIAVTGVVAQFVFGFTQDFQRE